jgi:hypothetical protein
MAFYSPDILFPDEIVQGLVDGSKRPLVPHVLADLLPDAHSVGIALELEDGKEDDLFVARHEFFHGFLQLISMPDINIYAAP